MGQTELKRVENDVARQQWKAAAEKFMIWYHDNQCVLGQTVKVVGIYASGHNSGKVASVKTQYSLNLHICQNMWHLRAKTRWQFRTTKIAKAGYLD